MAALILRATTLTVGSMAFNKKQILDIYRRRAKYYDVTSNLYYLIGLRIGAMRDKVVSALELQPGDTVVELGCGTGLNFSRIQQAVGPTGTILGVDMSEEMLRIARARIQKNKWKNVTLIKRDIARFDYPVNPNGILSTFALTLVPEYEEVIIRSEGALEPEGSLSLLDFRRPDKMPEWLVRSLAFLSRPFGVTLDLQERRPWEVLEAHFPESRFETYWFDCVYVASGRLTTVRSLHQANAVGKCS